MNNPNTPAASVPRASSGAAGSILAETDWQLRVTDAARLHGWKHCHTRKAHVRKGRVATPTSVKGWPDLVLWHPIRGEVLFVELKTDVGRMSVEQAEVLASLASAGAKVAVWRPKDWPIVLAFLRGPDGQEGVA